MGEQVIENSLRSAREWGGVVRGQSDFGPKCSLPFQGQKKSRFSGTNGPRNGFSRVKIITSPRHMNNRYINSSGPLE